MDIREILLKEGTGYTRNKNNNKPDKITGKNTVNGSNQDFQEIMKQCQDKSKEEIQQILRTKKGKALVQEFMKTAFPKK